MNLFVSSNNQKNYTQNSKQQRRKLVKVVDSLNPYIASANVRLILDLIATRSGVGLALRCLSFLEMDVQNNWKPFKPVLQYIRYHILHEYHNSDNETCDVVLN